MSRRIKVFFDGGCRPNPGVMEAAVVAAGQTTILRNLGYGTSTDAEWLALIQALTIAQSRGIPDFVLIGDAADIVAKANGTRKCGRGDAHHLERFRALTLAGGPSIRHIKRSQNLAGIALAKLHDR